MQKVTKKILAFNSSRNPQIAQIKYRLLSESAFRFYRGTCHLFYEALAKEINWKDATKCLITGDLHLENFGTYRGDNRVVYFDMNDFDEALLAPATWELVRLVTSIHVAAHELMLDGSLAESLCHTYLDAYIHVLQNGKPVVIEQETATGLLQFFLEQVGRRTHKQFIQSRIEKRGKSWKIILDKKKTLPCSSDEKQRVAEALSHWLKIHRPGKKLEVIDICCRVAGTGSVGLERFAALVYEKNEARFHLIDIKESLPSCVAAYCKYKQPVWDNEAERVVTLQKRVQHVSPAFLHTLAINHKSFVVKELQPTQDRMDLALCKGKKNKLAGILVTMGQATASGQLRSGGRQGSSIADDMIAFASAAPVWKKALLQYAKKYAAQVLKDFTAYKKDYDKGALKPGNAR